MDYKLDFLSKFAQWIEEGSYSPNFYLSKQTANAFISCDAS